MRSRTQACRFATGPPQDTHRGTEVANSSNAGRKHLLGSGRAYIDGKPAIISDDFFDERIVRGTELARPEDTTRENILAEAGYEQVYDIDEIITRMPTPEEIERLDIPGGTPAAEHIRTGYTAADKPVRVMVSIIPGDTLILQYTIPT